MVIFCSNLQIEGPTCQHALQASARCVSAEQSCAKLNSFALFIQAISNCVNLKTRALQLQNCYYPQDLQAGFQVGQAPGHMRPELAENPERQVNGTLSPSEPNGKAEVSVVNDKHTAFESYKRSHKDGHELRWLLDSQLGVLCMHGNVKLFVQITQFFWVCCTRALFSVVHSVSWASHCHGSGVSYLICFTYSIKLKRSYAFFEFSSLLKTLTVDLKDKKAKLKQNVLKTNEAKKQIDNQSTALQVEIQHLSIHFASNSRELSCLESCFLVEDLCICVGWFWICGTVNILAATLAINRLRFFPGNPERTHQWYWGRQVRGTGGDTGIHPSLLQLATRFFIYILMDQTETIIRKCVSLDFI